MDTLNPDTLPLWAAIPGAALLSLTYIGIRIAEVREQHRRILAEIERERQR